MNDISLKIEESPKDQIGVEVLASVESGADNEVDPLAIDDVVSGTISNPLIEVSEDSNKEKAEICDENVKEKINNECPSVDSVKWNVMQSEERKGKHFCLTQC